MTEKEMTKLWERLGNKLGAIEKKHKLTIHLCDEILPIVEKIELRARIDEGKKYD